MQLGFVSAILPELPLSEVLEFAATEGFDCVELMCWPPGKAERRYAGVTHVDVTTLDAAAAGRLNRHVADAGVVISGLGYYPNPLSPDPTEAEVAVRHIGHVMEAAARLSLTRVNTFVGRNPSLSVDENWPRFLSTWGPLIDRAEQLGLRVGIENCPMLFTRDEWPGGKNLAVSPTIWRRMFGDIPSTAFGLNFDPSHLIWQMMDCSRPIHEFADRITHVHAKDAHLDRARLDEVGILAHPLEYHDPRLPGRGDVDWQRFFADLSAIDYDGPVCVEVEDRDHEGSLDDRKRSLRESLAFMRGCLGLG